MHVYIKWNIDVVWVNHNTKRNQVGWEEDSFPSNRVNWEIEWMLIKVVYQDSNLFCD